jgi:PAS domain S-box-containing protein
VLTDLNPSAERIDALNRADAIGRDIIEVLPWARSAGLADVIARVARTGTAEQLTSASGPAGAEWRDALVCKAADGEIIVVYDDVSVRRRTDDALKESEGRWRSLIETETIGVVLVDQNFDICYVNKAAETLFGQNAHQLTGAPFGFPVTVNDVAEIEILRYGRGIVHAEMRAVPVRVGGVEQQLLLLQDISTYKRAEGDLRKLFQAIEQSPSSVVITDIQGRIEYVNPKFTEVSGYTYPEVVGKNPSILKSGFTSPEEYRRLWQTISSGKVWRGEFHNRKKSGELFWEMAAIAPVRDGTDRITHFVAVKEDVTERKITEEQLRVSQRLELIGQLTGGIAHDFNNLLGIIVGNLQLLQERPGLDAETGELVADALWSAQRGAQLTHRLLAFARQQRLHPKVLNVNEVVAELTDLLRRILGERIEIRETLAAEIWETKLDRAQFESALLNLAVNARDAMPEGGTLTITTSNITLPSPAEPRLNDATPGDYVSLSVRDSGSGMPPDVLQRIFEPFFTTKKVGEGSGLGLSMVYGFIRQSSGYVLVDSRPDDGTTVTLYLPTEARPTPAARPPDRPIVDGSKAEGTISVPLSRAS